MDKRLSIYAKTRTSIFAAVVVDTYTLRRMPQIEPGAIVDGKYRVERVLGSGGMGYVVAARHLQLDQIVALKFMRPGVIETDEARARFYREAKASVRLRSEHVARVLDIGVLPDGDPFMVMEYLDGQDLAAIARDRGIIPLAEACDYVLQACDALAEAHANGVVHRDIKLANLFVTRGANGAPHLKVLDFGISKANPFGSTDVEMTSTASMLGSPRFMSPEQMRDPRDVDQRSDVWSLGVILYRLTAGRAPFDSDTLGRLFSMVMHEIPPPIRSIAPELPVSFELIVMRCLVKEREGRVQNVAELASALVPFSTNPVRAQQIAEKAAHVLSLPAAPLSSPNSSQGVASNPFPLASPNSPNTSAAYAAYASARDPRRMPSGPPGANETIDASVWGVTNAESGKKKKPQSRGPMFATAALFLIACATGGVAIRAKYIQQHAVASLPPTPESQAPRALALDAVPNVAIDSLPTADVKPPPTSNDGDRALPPVITTSTPSTSAVAASSVAMTPQKEKSSAPSGRWKSQAQKSNGSSAPKPAQNQAQTVPQKTAPVDDTAAASGGIPNSRD